MLPVPPLFLPDTPIFVHYVRDDALAGWVRGSYAFDNPATTLLISAVIEGEVRSLALQFGWGKRRLERLEEMLGRALVVPLDYPGVIEAYARIDAHCRRLGTPIGGNDTWMQRRRTPRGRGSSPRIETSTNWTLPSSPATGSTRSNTGSPHPVPAGQGTRAPAGAAGRSLGILTPMVDRTLPE